MQSSLPPSYAEATLQDLPGLRNLLRRGEFSVYSRNFKSKHEVKSDNKEVLFLGKWKNTSPILSTGPTVHNLIITTVDKKEVLNMTRTIEGFFVAKKKDFVMTAIPDTPIGRMIKDEEKLYKVIDQSGQVVLHVERISKLLSSHYKILTPDGREIGTIGDNSGSKHKLLVPANLSLSHKCLLLGLALSIQNDYDDAQNASTASSGGAAAVASC